MTLKTDLVATFSVGVAPSNLGGLVVWCNRLFNWLSNFLRRPEFPGIVLSRIETVLQPEFKAEDGLLIYAAPGVLGPQEGLYIRELGTWKKLAGT